MRFAGPHRRQLQTYYDESCRRRMHAASISWVCGSAFPARRFRRGWASILVPIFLIGAAFAQKQPSENVSPEIGAFVEKTGTTVISVGAEWDIDNDIVGFAKGADLTWSHVYTEVDDSEGNDFLLSVEPRLTFPPFISARIVKIEDKTYEAVDRDYLSALPIYRRFIPRRVLTPGTVLAIRTTEGAFAKLRVSRYYAENEYSSKKGDSAQAAQSMPGDVAALYYWIELEWTLYREAGKAKVWDREIARERLSQAMGQWDVEAVKALLAADPQLATSQARFWASPLHEAALWSNGEILEVLLDAGADVNGTGETPDTRASQGLAGENDRERARIHRFRLDSPPLVYAVKYAVKSGRIENVEILCAHGANVNVKVNDEQTLLAYAVYWGDPQIVELLLRKGAKLPESRRERKQIEKAFRDGIRHVQESFGTRLPDTADLSKTDHAATRRVLQKYGYK